MGKSTRPGNPQQIVAMEKVLAAIRVGMHRAHAADAAGISRTHLWRWLNPEVMEGEPYDSFRASIALAEAAFINAQMAHILAAGEIPNEKTGQVDWKAKAWVLERRFSAFFGTKIQQEHTGPGGGPIQTEDKTLTDPQVKERLEEALGILREIGKVDLVTNGHRPGEAQEVLK